MTAMIAIISAVTVRNLASADDAQIVETNGKRCPGGCDRPAGQRLLSIIHFGYLALPMRGCTTSNQRVL